MLCNVPLIIDLYFVPPAVLLQFFRYGLEFVRYVLYRKWLGRYPRVHLRGRVVSGEFEAKMQARGRGKRQLLLLQYLIGARLCAQNITP